MRTPKKGNRADEILDAAERCVQERGFNGFSYADLSDALGLRKASIHHHFPSKADLGTALVKRYRERFGEALRRIAEANEQSTARLRRYTDLYMNVLENDHRMCLCGMLAAELHTLPTSMRTEIRRFFEDNERWVSGVLEQGRRRRELVFQGSAKKQAQLWVSLLEGSMLLSRSYGDIGRFASMARGMLAGLRAGAPGGPRQHA